MGMFSECMCCDEQVKKMNMLYLDSPFLEPFLQNKFNISTDQDEYDLYWRWLIHNKRKEEGIRVLYTILEAKRSNLQQKIRHLNIIYAFDASAKILLDLAEIQSEIEERMNINLDDLLGANDL